MAPLSIAYLLFITIGLLLYYTIFKKIQWPFLLAISLLFYYWCADLAILYIIAEGFLIWGGAFLLDNITRGRRLVFWTCLSLNVFFLLLIKFPDFVSNIIGKGFLAPLGISFISFSALSYLIDVYNRKYPAEKNFFKTFLFISFFPQITQGPINRWEPMQQLFVSHRLDRERFERNMLLILFGLMKKYAIADSLSGFVNGIFDYDPASQPGSIIAFGIVLFAFQEYTDFSGGIDIVLGVAGLFGINMAPNFRQPYFSKSLAEFWRRWHITLGEWMKEYVFFPFALTKPMLRFISFCRKKMSKSISRTLPASLTTILVFFCVGLWHGREYIAWGLYNGIVIAVSDLLTPLYKNLKNALHINDKTRPYTVFQIIRTFVVVGIGWYFDRITNLGHSIAMLRQTFLNWDICEFRESFHTVLARSNPYFWRFTIVSLSIAAISFIILLIFSILRENNIDVYLWLKMKKRWIRWGLCYAMMMLIMLSLIFSDNPTGFMYEKF